MMLKSCLALAAVLLVGLVALGLTSYQRGREIEALDLLVAGLVADNNALAAENAGLKRSAQAVSAAAQAQSMVCQAELIRRVAIEEITEAKPASIKPEAAVDDETSRKAVRFLNSDLFAPLGLGLRRAEAGAGADGAAVPGFGPARAVGFE